MTVPALADKWAWWKPRCAPEAPAAPEDRARTAPQMVRAGVSEDVWSRSAGIRSTAMTIASAAVDT